MHGAGDEEAVDAARHAAMQAYEQSSPGKKKSKAIKIGKVGLSHDCPVWLVPESASAYIHESETQLYTSMLLAPPVAGCHLQHSVALLRESHLP